MEEGIPNKRILWNSFDVVVMKTTVGRNKHLDINALERLGDAIFFSTLLKAESL